MASSAETTTTRRHRPARIQSSASDERLGGAGARGVDLGVRPAGADDLGELGVPHRQARGTGSAGRTGRARARAVSRSSAIRRVDLGTAGSSAGIRARSALDGEQPLAAAAVEGSSPPGLGEAVVTGEGRGEDDAGLVAQRLGQAPAVGQLGAERRGLVAHDERDAGVAQRVEAGADGQPGRRVEGLVAGRVDAELLDDVEGRVHARPA